MHYNFHIITFCNQFHNTFYQDNTRIEIFSQWSTWGFPISHLLWADDLILLALTPEAAQKQLNILANFCHEWGIEVNQSKTKCVVFGNDKNNSNTEPKFYLQDKLLENVD